MVEACGIEDIFQQKPVGENQETWDPSRQPPGTLRVWRYFNLPESAMVEISECQATISTSFHSNLLTFSWTISSLGTGLERRVRLGINSVQYPAPMLLNKFGGQTDKLDNSSSFIFAGDCEPKIAYLRSTRGT